jgi:hypothetical protein
MCICCIPCRELVRQSRPSSLQGIQHLHIHTIQYNNITVHSLMCNKLSQKFLFEDILCFYNYNIFFLTFSCVFYKHRKKNTQIVVRGLMVWFAPRNRGLSDKVIAGEVVSNFLAVMDGEVRYLLLKNPSSQMDSVRLFTPSLTTIQSNIILAFISVWHCKNLRTKTEKELD